jgi:hypothetical protein
LAGEKKRSPHLQRIAFFYLPNPTNSIKKELFTFAAVININKNYEHYLLFKPTQAGSGR